ncbi:class I SAM-dependent rRNA methyltransferase [Caproicibacterium sp. XB2]|uniref:class I SAM-dependent rRNA methyltransferase n=1 Tax=Caproicibacterium sp. XB2 TaxID=3388458 RepID=UPI00384F98DC
MKNRDFPQVTVTKKAEDSIVGGHPWIYDTEVTPIGQAPQDGTLTDVLSTKDRYMGTGFYNSHSKIRVRLISRNANDTFDAAFFKRRIQYAWDYRKTVMGPDADCCRIIFGEADRFPGLTVDRFHNILVTQTLSLGIERLKPMLFQALYEVLTQDGQRIDGIYERNDVAIRELEGMQQGKGFYQLPGVPMPESTVTEITENGIRYLVDFENGQKTGFFLDQKYNRRAVAQLAKGRTVLDCFTHTGSFALNAAKGGAAHVHAVDISADAVAMTKENICRNGMETIIDCEQANVFDLLPSLQPKKYDFIILDPPAFTKSRKTVRSASRGYKEINLRAMRLLPRGGYLATCSCSHFMTDSLFRRMLHDAAADAGVALRQIEARQQAPDHPVLWNVPETDYLKFYLFQVV